MPLSRGGRHDDIANLEKQGQQVRYVRADAFQRPDCMAQPSGQFGTVV